jgi:hypothetical protein
VIVRELAPDVSVGFRDMVEGDRTFIISSWLRGFHKSGDWPRRLGTPRCPHDPNPCGCCRFTHRRYFDEHGPVIEQLLDRTRVVVACNPARDYQVIGYVVAEPSTSHPVPNLLHWVFVKSPYRWDASAEHHPRIGTALMEQAFGEYWNTYGPPVLCSHWTSQASHLARKWRLAYDPFPFALEEPHARG